VWVCVSALLCPLCDVAAEVVLIGCDLKHRLIFYAYGCDRITMQVAMSNVAQTALIPSGHSLVAMDGWLD